MTQRARLAAAKTWPLIAWGSLALGAAVPALAQQQDDLGEDGVSQAVVQPLPAQDTMQLNEALGRVARNPRDSQALLDAGNAAMEIGDNDAAIGFFRRAGQIAPLDGRVKAGLAGAFVRSGDPYSAIPMFDEAERSGAVGAKALADRGLAWDLVGNGPKAQDFYRRAIAQGQNDEALRRLAISLAIAGDRRGSEAALTPLLQRQDKAAWRSRIFALAIAGQTEEAVRVAETSMPAGLAGAIAPYLRYMRSLTPAQQAAAANLGQFPRASEIGRDDPRIAQYAPPKPVQVAVATPANGSGKRNDRSRRRSRDEQVAVADTRRPGSMLPAIAPSRSEPPRTQTPTPTPSATRVAAATPAPALTPAPVPARPATSVWPTAPLAVAAAAPKPPLPTPTPTPGPAPTRVPTPTPATTLARPVETAIAAVTPPPAPRPIIPATVTQTVTETRVATVETPPAPAPGFGSLEGVTKTPEVAGFDLARTTPPGATTPPAATPAPTLASTTPAPVAATTAPAPVVTPAPPPAAVAVAVPPAPSPASSAPPEVPRPSRTLSLAEAFSDLSAPPGEATPAPGAVDIRRIRPPRELSEELAAKEAAAKAPPPPSHPSRIWVQVATGRDKAALGFDWRRMLREAPEALRNRKGYTSAWGQTNRLLTGPFDSEAAANAFVTQLRRADVSGAFVWTSPAGQVVDTLGGK